MEKRTIVDQIEVTRLGVIQVRLKKQILDGATVLAEEYHRTSLVPGGDCDAQLAAVNTHLVSDAPHMNAAPLSEGDAEWQRVKAIAAAAWTPECLAAWAEHVARLQAEMKAQLAAKA